MDLATPCHLLQRLRVNAEKTRGLITIEQGFEIGYAEGTIAFGTDGAWGKASCHNCLLFQQNAPVFHRPSKTFLGNLDALWVSGGSIGELRGNRRRNWSINERMKLRAEAMSIRLKSKLLGSVSSVHRTVLHFGYGVLIDLCASESRRALIGTLH